MKLQILFDLGKPTYHLIYYTYQIVSMKSTGLAQDEAVNVEEA